MKKAMIEKGMNVRGRCVENRIRKTKGTGA
jgi:hypothetical protein